MEDNYPYQTFYGKTDQVMKRDNYTCQICGYYGVKKNNITATICIECENKGIEFHPFSDWKIPKPCRDKGLKYRTCGECPNYKEVVKEHVYPSNLVVHHKDGNKKNQALENLITVCRSCHRKFHHRGKTLTVDEMKKKIRKNCHK